MSRPNTTNRTLKFSHRAIESLPAPEADASSTNVEYTDAAESGLRIAVYKSGKRSFRHRYTYRGEKKMMTLGEFPAVNVEKARERVRANKALLAEDIDPLNERQRQREAVTFAEFAEQDYLPFAAKERKSHKDISNRVKQRLLPCFGKLQLPRITQREIKTFHVQLKAEVSAVTANRTLALLSGMFSLAVEMGLVTENPARGIKKFSEPGARKRVFSDQELQRFTKALAEVMDTPSGQAVYLMLTTGLRKSEVLSMAWKDIYLELDASKNRYFIKDPKNNKPRYVPLNDQASRLLEKMKQDRARDNEWVFPSGSVKGHLLDVRRTFQAILDKSQVSGVRQHDMRRTFATLLINNGVSVYEVRDLLGHSDVRTTQVYAHLATSTLHRASGVAGNLLEHAMNQGG